MKSKPKDIPYCGVRRQKIADFLIESIDADSLDTFLYFINERYKIHLRKDIKKLAPPYTKDPVLQKYRFTNVRREHDKNTKWVIDNICNNNSLKYGQKMVNIVLFRIFNKIETAEILEIPIADIRKVDAISLAEKVEALTDSTPYTGAYLCSGMKRYLKKYTGSDSSVESAILVVQDMCDHKFWKGTKSANSPEDIIDTLQEYPGLSEFMSYQLFVDFTYMEEFPFSENEYTLAGIGAWKGLRVLFGGKCKHRRTPEELIFWLRDNWNALNQYNIQQGGKHTLNPQELFRDIPEEDRKMNVMSIENCLCEFYKYWKVTHKLGRPRQKYKGGTR